MRCLALATPGLALGLLLGAGAAVAGEVGEVCVRDDASNVTACQATDVLATELVAFEVVEPCGSGGSPETALVVLEATLEAAISRQDLGFYLALAGGSAILDAACYHDYLAPPLDPNPTFGDANGNAIPDLSHGDAWYNAEPFDLVDDCGDIVGGTESIPLYGTPSVPLEIACVDTDDDDVVDAEVCVTWSNGTNDHCTGLSVAAATTSSRCGCTRLNVVGLPEPGAGAVLVLGGAWLFARRRRRRG